MSLVVPYCSPSVFKLDLLDYQATPLECLLSRPLASANTKVADVLR